VADSGITGRIDEYQQKHKRAGFPLAVLYKFFDDQGSYLAALITYYGFLSLFPFLLLFTSILGVVLRNNPDLQQRILSSAMAQFPVIGQQLKKPEGLGGGVTAIVIGGLTALYGGLGVAQAVQNAMNAAWAVPRNRRPNPIKARLRSMLLLATGGLAIIGATVLSAIGSSANAFGASLGGVVSILITLAAVLVNAGVFLLAFRISTAHRLTLRQAAPGAITAAVLWQLLQSFGTTYVGNVVKNASATNVLSAFVLGLLAFIYLAANALVLSVEVNVVLAKRLYPRSLLTPFTDNVDLTAGDQKAYADAAKAQTNKGFETVDVSFDNDGQNASAGQSAEKTKT
jgi:membrane protein